MEHVQLQLTTPHPLYDIWTTFGEHYSNCCWHVVNNREDLDVAAIKTPLILSRGAPHRPIPSELLHALISLKCLLTIMSISASDPNKDYFLAVISRSGRWVILQNLRPQTYIIFTNLDDQSLWLNPELLSEPNLQHWPEIFVLQDSSYMLETSYTFKIKFYCWYCRRVNAQTKHWIPTLDIIESSCSTGDFDCINAMNAVAAAVYDEGGHLWTWDSGSMGYSLRPLDPFLNRDKVHFRIDDAVAVFLYRINESITTSPYRERFYPYFQEAVRIGISSNGWMTQSVQYVGNTPAVKFFTLSAVSDNQSSYEIYLAPLKPSVWCMLIISVCISCLVEVFLHRGLSGLVLSTLLSDMCNLMYWKLSTLIGQSKEPLPPCLSSTFPQQRSTNSILIATALWFIGSTFLSSSYGGVFSADALRLFPYRTKYENLRDLENFTFYYLLSDRECTKFLQVEAPNVTMSLACNEGGVNSFPECGIVAYVNAAASHYVLKVLLANGNLKGSDVEKHSNFLQAFWLKGFPLCNGVPAVEKAIEAALGNGTNVAFVTYGYEFTHNWAVFKEIMNRHPAWKIANNFESDDQFGVQEKAYVFTSGLKRRYQDRFEGRLKTLVSSGIYGLWVKWQRIKFSMSGLRHDEKGLSSFSNGTPGDPVSFGNSALSWLFWAQFLAWFAAFIALCLERMLDEFTKKEGK